MTSSPTHITDRQSLRDLVERLRDHDRIALDTEFVGEDSFVARLELIQVAAGDLSAAIDFPAVGSLDDFGVLLADPAIEKSCMPGGRIWNYFTRTPGRCRRRYSIRRWQPPWWDMVHRSLMRS